MKNALIIISVLLGMVLVFTTGCNRDDLDSITGIVVLHENQPDELLAGDTFVFQVKANNGEYVTDEAVIKVNGQAIEGNEFSTAQEPAEYEVQATYQGMTSGVITVKTGNGFVRNVLVEDFTGTWCGWCPRVAYAIIQAEEQSDQIVSMAVHQNSTTEPDPFVTEEGTQIAEMLGVEGLPDARINRIHIWSAPENENIDEPASYTGFSPIGIAMTSAVNGDQLEVQVKVKFLKNIETGIRLHLLLLENGLIHDQTNYTHDLFSEGYENPLPGFVHNDVLRKAFTAVEGDDIPAEETQMENEYVYDLSETVPANVEDATKLSLVVFITDATTGEVLNARKAEVGEEAGYQQAQED